MFWVFGREACEILALWPGIKPAHPVLEGEVLTTGPTGKSQEFFISDIFSFFNIHFFIWLVVALGIFDLPYGIRHL